MTLKSNRWRGERGSAAMLAAVGMALLFVISLSFVSLAQLETKIGVNHAQEVRAVQAAEAGARRVFAQMVNGVDNAQGWLNKAQPIHSDVAVSAGGTARYTVSVVDNGPSSTGPDTDNIVAIRSQGAAGGARATVALFVQPGNPFAPTDAIRVNDDLRISAAPVVQGQCGSIHVATSGSDTTDTTVDIQVDRNPVASQGMSTSGRATGDYFKSPYPLPGGATQQAPDQGVTPRRVPQVDPKKFGRYADYVLGADGYAYQYDTVASTHSDPATWTCTTACAAPAGWIKLTTKCGGGTYVPGDCVMGWQYIPGTPEHAWTSKANSPDWGAYPGTFYVKGSARNLTTVGTPGTPYRLTLITEGYIKFVSDMNIHWDDLTTASSPRPSLNPLVPTDTLLVAGTDIEMPGNEYSHLWGMVAAHEQIFITNNGGTLNGFIIAESANLNDPNFSDYPEQLRNISNIKGDIHITYDCGMKPPELSTPPVVLKWGAL